MNTYSVIPIRFTLNGKIVSIEAGAHETALYVIRERLSLKGTKEGCGMGECGACTIHVGEVAMRSCTLPVSQVGNQAITTIEGLSENGDHPVQEAWLEHDVAQCGYCQAGQLMAAADLLQRVPKPSDEEINSSMTNICRCGTYVRIRKAIHRAAELQAEGDKHA